MSVRAEDGRAVHEVDLRPFIDGLPLGRPTDRFVTEDASVADRFTNEVDAAAVLVNVSTRFVDGDEFGFGAEIGISTQKLHARGPMGLEQLTTEKYVIHGTGQVRA